ncbi:E3 ubiquitin-protein ligase TRIM39-like [Anabas testudineus]|uniref:E3 ubiquitin-protein ligase TRIM39-like n=1 Tax=Anabas testudineus TaxID=64144 RepID=UPI000E456D0A|nr:E3 ubiquitin-protein ligase TRIM39-like [Anabas testudineus]
MASVFYSEDLTCSICLTIFSDPVTLLCGHSFCRWCITDVLKTKPQCPHCQAAVSTEGKCLPTSHILKSLAEKAKEAEKLKKEHGPHKAEAAELCPEHEEKLKLFCVTDQQLACMICRDGENHEGHKFKPIKEAAASLRKDLEMGIESLSGDIRATESLAKRQREEITKNKATSQQLMTQIHRQFEEMHQFLRKREDKIKNELKNKEEDAAEKMSKALKAMETALSECRKLEVKAASVLEIKEPDRFLKSWTEGNSMMTSEHLFRSRAIELQVVNTSLSLGPYESHLQFFMWKEMLQVIQPRAEQLSLKRNSACLTVSDDGRSLFCNPNSNQPPSGFVFGNTQTPSGSLFGSRNWSDFGQTTQSFHMSHQKSVPLFGSSTSLQQSQHSSASSSTSSIHACSAEEFSSGQHYWEIDVGSRDYWELGIKDFFLKRDGQTYSTCSGNIIRALTFTDRPRKIGIYLNCLSPKLSFYDADKMTHIYTMSTGLMVMPVSAYINISYRSPDPNPMTVCWY